MAAVCDSAAKTLQQIGCFPPGARERVDTARMWQHPNPSFLALGALSGMNADSLGSGSRFLTLAGEG